MPLTTELKLSRPPAGRSRLPVLATALSFLLLGAGSLGCIPNPAAGEQTRSSWGACATRTDQLPVPVVRAGTTDRLVFLGVSVSDTGSQQADAILLYRYTADRDIDPIAEIPLSDGAGSQSFYIVPDPDVHEGFDARTIRRNAVGQTVCSFDVGPTDTFFDYRID
ncbi:MAG: hypothetical protein OXF79_20865 [Chloroflexi bacterium]|nr:hypothetical protein [Chloroflexota bacterium]